MSEQPSKELRLAEAARALAIMALQSERYKQDGEFRDACDDVLSLTRHAVEKACDAILKHLERT